MVGEPGQAAEAVGLEGERALPGIGGALLVTGALGRRRDEVAAHLEQIGVRFPEAGAEPGERSGAALVLAGGDLKLGQRSQEWGVGGALFKEAQEELAFGIGVLGGAGGGELIAEGSGSGWGDREQGEGSEDTGWDWAWQGSGAWDGYVVAERPFFHFATQMGQIGSPGDGRIIWPGRGRRRAF